MRTHFSRVEQTKTLADWSSRRSYHVNTTRKHKTSFPNRIIFDSYRPSLPNRSRNRLINIVYVWPHQALPHCSHDLSTEWMKQVKERARTNTTSISTNPPIGEKRESTYRWKSQTANLLMRKKGDFAHEKERRICSWERKANTLMRKVGEFSHEKERRCFSWERTADGREEWRQLSRSGVSPVSEAKLSSCPRRRLETRSFQAASYV